MLLMFFATTTASSSLSSASASSPPSLALLPASFPADLAAGVLIALQGLWFYQMALSLYGPMLLAGCVRDAAEPNRVECRSRAIAGEMAEQASKQTLAICFRCIRIQNLQPGQIIMDIDFRWGGDPSIILAVDAVVASLPIQDTVNSIVSDMLQWLHRLVVPLGVNVDTSDLELKPQGKLSVTVVKATSLRNKELIGKSDPYVRLYVRPMFKVKTKVIDDNLNPEWNETFELIVEDKETQSVIFEVYDEDKLQQDKRLGVAKLAVNSLEPEITREVMYHPFTKEEQVQALEAEKQAIEERKRLKEAGIIGSTMDAVGGAASLVGSGVQLNEGILENEQPTDEECVHVDVSVVDTLHTQRVEGELENEASDDEGETGWQYVSDNEGRTIPHDDDDDDSDMD
ncbi:integral membrane single C2 domain protein [Panicum miliaceum]|uniref:Integral membrane single C2 domain protein n=1 Tax=Panicum miliaceum TaxID=4540 RepID=A0A3L6T6M1_PANMI|nr:integral membrane single C2 domain protein [Panicum miliaceum]